MMIFKVKLILLASIAVSLQACSQTLSSEKTSEGIWVKDAGEKVLFYQSSTKSLDGKFARANYVHPLYNVDGFELTEDFPKDHLHHRGIFWTWHQVIIGDEHIGDAWECKDFIWDVVAFEASKDTENSLTLNTKTMWKSPIWKDDIGNLKPFVKEQTNITVHKRKDNYRIVDFEISLLALEKDLKIGGSNDVKGYGGFSPRIKLPKNILFTSTDGEVIPRTEQVVAGSWMDMSGTLTSENGQGGVIMICHPDNPGYPEKWILRDKGSMQNPAFPGRQPYNISTTNPTVLKYRLVTYTGHLERQVIDELTSW